MVDTYWSLPQTSIKFYKKKDQVNMNRRSLMTLLKEDKLPLKNSTVTAFMCQLKFSNFCNYFPNLLGFFIFLYWLLCRYFSGKQEDELLKSEKAAASLLALRLRLFLFLLPMFLVSLLIIDDILEVFLVFILQEYLYSTMQYWGISGLLVLMKSEQKMLVTGLPNHLVATTWGNKWTRELDS